MTEEQMFYFDPSPDWQLIERDERAMYEQLAEFLVDFVIRNPSVLRSTYDKAFA